MQNMEKTVETLVHLFRTHVLEVLQRKHHLAPPQYKVDEKKGIMIIDIRHIAAQAAVTIRTEIRKILGDLGIIARPRKRGTVLHVSFLPS